MIFNVTKISSVFKGIEVIKHHKLSYKSSQEVCANFQAFYAIAATGWWRGSVGIDLTLPQNGKRFLISNTMKDTSDTMKRRRPQTHRVQLAAAVAVMLAGVGLLVAGFVVSPVGEIHHSVLVGFGEALTFAAAILGVDYHYNARRYGEND